MTLHLYPFDLPPIEEMNTAQLDGQECVYCPGNSKGSMKPVGRLLGTLLFAHLGCAEAHQWDSE